jgi:Ca2+-binding RTX toxin-like protein
MGPGDDHFNGGNNAETVVDGRGQDTYKFGGGDDTYLSSTFSTGDGNDIVDGGTGRDTYDFSSTNAAFVVNLDTVAHGTAAANSGTYISNINGPVTDKVFNFEDVIGSDQSDTIYGNAAANHLVGGGRADTLYGLGGNDVLDASGSSGGVSLYGGDGNDILIGGTGNSDLYGGAGRDILTGGDPEGTGTPAEIFHFQSLSDSGVTAATRDVITDFQAGACFIDLSQIDAIKGTPGSDFTFIGESKWHHVAGELCYVSTATQTIVEADVNGDAKVDFSVALDGHHALTATDFIGVVV